MLSQKQQHGSASDERTGRLPALDGIRGTAVLFVLLDHASDAEMFLFPGADLNRLGKYGVYLFFVLSAFLLTLQFCGKQPHQLLERKTWEEYGLRRFLRIFPLYAVVLVAMVAMGKIALGDIPTHLVLQDGKRVFWTIAVEVKFYLILPLIVLAFMWAGRKQWWFGAAAIAAASGSIIGLLQFEKAWSLHHNVLLGPNLPPFLIGTATAALYYRLQRADIGTRWATWFEIAAISALVATLLRVPAVYSALFLEEPVGKLAFDPAICGALWSIMILGVVLGRGWLGAVFNWKPLRYLGMISFSAYLWHFKFITDVDDLPVPPFLRLLVFLALVIAIASLSYFLFERPLLKVRRGNSAPEPEVPILTPVISARPKVA